MSRTLGNPYFDPCADDADAIADMLDVFERLDRATPEEVRRYVEDGILPPVDDELAAEFIVALEE